jgi:hypothetical protein
VIGHTRSFLVAALAGSLWMASAASAAVLIPAAAPTAAFAQPQSEPEIFSLEDYEANSRRGADRDAFPVLDDPKLSTVANAEGVLSPEEPVIGLRIGKVAHAYPISVMGGVELVNDKIGDLPVTVSW